MIVLLLCVVQGSLNDTGFGADVLEGKLCRGRGNGVVGRDSKRGPHRLDRLA